jgi:thioredoxin reductase (NADPH)
MNNQLHDVIIIGSGPAGYTAGIYLSRARLNVLLFSGHEVGGQLMYTTDIENFPGFPEGINGPQLMIQMRLQAEKFGTQIIDDKVESVGKEGSTFSVQVGEQKYQSKAVVIATGAKARMQGLVGEDALLGRGVSTCAVCDAAFFRDQTVFVVGGGDSAVEDSLALARFTDKVTLVHRRDTLRASKIMQERLLNNPHIQVKWNASVTAVHQENGKLSAITLKDLQANKEDKVKAEGLFYAIGHDPATSFLNGLVKVNSEGYIVTRLGLDKDSTDQASQFLSEAGRLLYPTMTSQEGVFAAGDNVDFMYRQAVTAAGFGTMAALDAERWLERQG